MNAGTSTPSLVSFELCQVIYTADCLDLSSREKSSGGGQASPVLIEEREQPPTQGGQGQQPPTQDGKEQPAPAPAQGGRVQPEPTQDGTGHSLLAQAGQGHPPPKHAVEKQQPPAQVGPCRRLIAHSFQYEVFCSHKIHTRWQ